MSLLVDIEKTLGSFHLQVQLEAGDETLALLGASGCGKSLTLRCIAGIEKPDKGRIIVDGRTLFDSEKKIDLPPQQRRTGLLFQNYALFPHMTVLQNVQTGACRERDKRRRDAAVCAIMERFGLTELSDHLPRQLSGGQQQRTALARILISAPDILLLDEPFSALDSHLRFRLEQEVRQVMAQFGKTVLLVSHDRNEVFRMSDSIAIMAGGSILTCGPKQTVFADPQTTTGAILTGCKNISAAVPLEDGRIWATDWGIPLETAAPTTDVTAVGIRMHEIRLGLGPNAHRCRVVGEIENPCSYTVLLQATGGQTPIGCELEKAHWQTIRAPEITISLPPEALLLLNDTKKRGSL